MSEPTCECGHSRYDHEDGDYADIAGPCTEWDCGCEFYWGDEDEDEEDQTSGPFPSGVSLAASQRWDAAWSGSGPARRGAVLAAVFGRGVRRVGRVVLTGVGWLTGWVRSCRPELRSSVTRSNRLDRFPRSTVPVGQTVRPAADAPPVPAVTSPRVVPPVRAGRSRAFRTVRTDSPGPGFRGGSGGDAA